MSTISGFGSIPLPPTPADPLESQRWDHTRLRRRLLDGAWEQDLRNRIREHVGSVRAGGFGAVDVSSNPFRVISRELACLYLGSPDIRHDSGPVDALVEAVEASGLWAQAPRFQCWVIGCREYLLRVHADAEGGLSYRPVPPDMVIATSHADRPDVPVRVQELRLRAHPDTGAPVWTWDLLDVGAPEPTYAILECLEGGKVGADWTAAYLGQSMTGEAYPYRKSDGTPILPYVLFHAERTGDRLWDYSESTEIVEGSLNLAVAYSHWYHVLRDASWPQRYAMGAAPAGAAVTDTDDARRAEVVTDPATLLVMEPIREDGPQPQIGQWQAGGDVESLERAISAMANRLAQDAGVPPSDIQRLGGTARSGYAIALSNDGKRQAQRRFAPQFRDGDQRLMAVSAALLNRATGSALPEDGYRVVYREVPLSPQELQARRDHVLALLEKGLMSPVSAYMELNPGLSPEQARQDLEQIQRARALLTLTT